MKTSLIPALIPGIEFVFSDLDGTLTSPTDGLKPEVYRSFSTLHQRGISVVIVSGCPAGWADTLIRLCPSLTAVIYENGAGYYFRSKDTPRRVDLVQSQASAESRREFLLKRFEELKKNYPHLRLSADYRFRLEDVAIDYAQDPPGLSEKEVMKVREFLNSFPEITAQQSSIHINYWYGRHNKLTACQALSKALFKIDLSDLSQKTIFVGDAPNDTPLFETFFNSVGVANILPFLPQMTSAPKWITSQPYGDGFLEVVNSILSSDSSR